MNEYLKPDIEVLEVDVIKSTGGTQIGIGSNTLPDEDENW